MAMDLTNGWPWPLLPPTATTNIKGIGQLTMTTAALAMNDVESAAEVMSQDGDRQKEQHQLVCSDDLTYVSKMGAMCVQHASVDCNGFLIMGFNEQEMDELLSACPVSCKVEPCIAQNAVSERRGQSEPELSHSEAVSTVNGNPRTGEHATAFQVPTQLPFAAFTKHEVLTTTRTDHHMRRRANQAPCFEGWDSTCRDNPTYRSPMDTDCSAFESFDCDLTMSIGFLDVDVDLLVENCPCSCGIECG
mmetsp:Transcript_21341/g.43868  ORF Transcript_21341/g.43868 Transcript_21341/m.43868 type:complete len:247 (+) Transcript_21341:62-802(+)